MSQPTLTEPQLAELAVRFTDALLDSADTDVIGVAHWWDRATSALTSAATSAGWYGQLVSKASEKLQIHELKERSATTLAALETEIAPVFAEWCELAARDTVYLIALTRVRRAARSAERQNKKGTTS